MSSLPPHTNSEHSDMQTKRMETTILILTGFKDFEYAVYLFMLFGILS